MTYPFPLEIEQIFDECIMDLRPKFNRATSYAKACEQVENIEKEFIALISKKNTVQLLYFVLSFKISKMKGITSYYSYRISIKIQIIF